MNTDTTQKKIFILLGHPDSEDTFSAALAKMYEEGARAAGNEVRRVNLGDIAFDPILHKGYKVIQELEPDLVAIQEHIKWADHFVVIYPNWWNTMPALLKGFFDRAWLPGFAFNFDKKTGEVIQHFAGKTARVIIVSGTHSPLMTRLKFGDFKNEIQQGILQFSGFQTRVTTLGPCEKCGDTIKNKWLADVRELGARCE